MRRLGLVSMSGGNQNLGRVFSDGQLERTRELLGQTPELSRWKLSRQLAREWQWYSPSGQLRDMAVRTALLKLEALGQIVLPLRRCPSPNRMGRKQLHEIEHQSTPIQELLSSVRPLRIQEVSGQQSERALFEWLLHRYHYLGYRGSVGMNLKYLVWDRQERPLACLLFSSAAWKCASRDEFIGWSHSIREQRINWITNNSRFLILPWVEIGCLASHLLSVVSGGLREHWRKKYGQELYAVETFVERERFSGTCYRAANWQRVGQTRGRSRQDRHHQMRVPIKDVYLKPLERKFRAYLSK